MSKVFEVVIQFKANEVKLEKCYIKSMVKVISTI